jgi:hypothetical protein
MASTHVGGLLAGLLSGRERHRVGKLGLRRFVAFSARGEPDARKKSGSATRSNSEQPSRTTYARLPDRERPSDQRGRIVTILATKRSGDSPASIVIPSTGMRAASVGSRSLDGLRADVPLSGRKLRRVEAPPRYNGEFGRSPQRQFREQLRGSITRLLPLGWLMGRVRHRRYPIAS